VARLPIPGQDAGTWGDILNQYLAVSLNGNGSIQTGAIAAAGGELTANKNQPGGYPGLDGSSNLLIQGGIVADGSVKEGQNLTGDVYNGSISGTAVLREIRNGANDKHYICVLDNYNDTGETTFFFDTPFTLDNGWMTSQGLGSLTPTLSLSSLIIPAPGEALTGVIIIDGV